MGATLEILASDVGHLTRKVDRLIENHEEDREQIRRLVAASEARAPYEKDMHELLRHLPERLVAVETSTSANNVALAALAQIPAKVASLEAINAQDSKGFWRTLIASDGFLRTTGGLALAGSILTAAVGVFGLIGVAAGWWSISDATTAFGPAKISPVTSEVRPAPPSSEQGSSEAH